MNRIKELLGKAREEWKELVSGDPPLVLVGTATCGRSAGAMDALERIRSESARRGLPTRIVEVGCLGPCFLEPLVAVLRAPGPGVYYHSVDPDKASEIVARHIEGGAPVEGFALGSFGDGPAGKIPPLDEAPLFKPQVRRILRRSGWIDPRNIRHYMALGGYEGVLRAFEIGPEKTLAEIQRSGLRGRGGAGFPTWRKWQFCREAPGRPKYVVCNADEGDPGAFMNRALLESDPHAILEGMLIAGWVLGASEGTIYCRAEYPLALERIDTALKQAAGLGLTGEDILGTGFAFRFRVKEGAGAFVCGEETALLASIEGSRGMPRPRPPFPAVSGLLGRPTVINNVETLASAAMILQKGADWFAEVGTAACKGTKTFSLVGKVQRPGLVEVPLGISLRTMIEDIGGGVPDGKQLKAVQTGGPSGGCIPARSLDIPVDYDSLTAAGTIMGSGGMVVMDETTCMVDFARYFLDFACKESCGKCSPCRTGTRQMLEILTDITRGRAEPRDLEVLAEVAEAVRKSALCGLGQTAPNPVITTLRYFRDEYETHVRKKRCPSFACKEIISSPCQHVCPIGTEVPVYVAQIAAGRFAEAFETIHKDNPLPSVCARVCHHPCESRCSAGKWGSPVAIRALKRFAVDRAVAAGLHPGPAGKPPSGPRVAIVGSGPAGLMAGYQLARRGYRPTIFEAFGVAGGALAICIPPYRLPKAVLSADIEGIRRIGVEIVTNTRVGVDLPWERLRSEFAAVFLAPGAHRSRELNLPSMDVKGVRDALDFLKEALLWRPPMLGTRVGVVGGGNVAIDAARMAIRLTDAKQVSVIYRRTREEMPALEEEIEAAVEEGIEFLYLSAPAGIASEQGVLKGLTCQRMELGAPDETGRRRPVPVKGAEFFLPLDSLLVAIGEEPHTVGLGEGLHLEITKEGRIVADPETCATRIPGIFAGGDAVTGAATVVEGMAAGKVAAEMIDRFIRGEPVAREYRKTRPTAFLPPVTLSEAEIESAKRPESPRLPVAERKAGIREVESTLAEETAVREARRCLRCDLDTEDGKAAMEAAKRAPAK